MRIDVGGAELAVAIEGEPDAPAVILAHGFPDCARSFRFQVPALLAAGFRIVVPTMRGYAPSSLARDGRYDAAALGDDLCALARRVSPDAPVDVVGHDWGAVACYAATARAPELFRRMVTASVPHLRVAGPRFFRPAQLRRSWYIAFFQLRGLAERRVAAHDFQFIDRLWRESTPPGSFDGNELAQVKNGFREPSHLRAVLSYYRQIGHAGSRRLVTRRTSVPALYVHGEADSCVGVELADGVERAYTAGVRVLRIPGAGHFVHQDAPEAFNRGLLEFLARS